MASQSHPGLSIGEDGARRVVRALPEEVPVALSFDGSTLAVMMASPADIEDFAFGFAHSEGVIDTPGDVSGFELVEHTQGLEARFWLKPGRGAALKTRQRSLIGPVGCGLCGIDSLEAAVRPLPRVRAPGLRFDRAEVIEAVETLRHHQPLHDRTRAVHAAGFLRPGAGLGPVREDVGRHNALDKLIGALLRAGEDPAGGAIVLSSRISVEMVQKTALAGAAVIIAASAPTAHALRLAEGAGMTLAAFVRGGRFDLYAHAERIETGASDVA